MSTMVYYMQRYWRSSYLIINSMAKSIYPPSLVHFNGSCSLCAKFFRHLHFWASTPPIIQYLVWEVRVSVTHLCVSVRPFWSSGQIKNGKTMWHTLPQNNFSPYIRIKSEWLWNNEFLIGSTSQTFWNESFCMIKIEGIGSKLNFGGLEELYH